MPAAKKPKTHGKSPKKRKPRRAYDAHIRAYKAKKAAEKRYKPKGPAEGFCKGECRIRTKGMKVGDTRRRISRDGKKLVITRVG